MSLAKYAPGAKQPVEPKLPKVSSDNYKGVVVDDRYQCLRTLSMYSEGYPMTVDFYSQILGTNNDVREVDPAQSGVYQQYSKINNLDIRVDSPLEMQYDDDSGLSAITGSAYIYPDIVPNTYDYFTTRTTRGKLSLFRITTVTRKSMNRDSLHQVQYQMVGYVDTPGNAQDAFKSLVDKVSRQYYFHGDRLIEGKSPLLKPQEHEYVEQLHKNYASIVAYYCNSFYNDNYQTLVVPGQPSTVYDKFLVDFLLKIMSITDHERIETIKQFGSDQDRFMDQPQFWKAIIERNPIYIAQANKFMGLVNRAQFMKDRWVAGAGLSAIDKYIYPLTGDTSTSVPKDSHLKVGQLGLVDTSSVNGTFYDSLDNTFKSITGDILIYKRLLADSYYVLSRDFYELQTNWSLLEKVTWDYLEGKAIQLNELVVLTKKYYSLNRLEQFYYGPLLMTFIKDSRSSQYS